MAERVTIEAPGLERLSRDLLLTSAELVAGVTEALSKAGQLVEDRGRRNAAASGSTSIPQSIIGGTTRPGEYRIDAGGENIPIAGLWEYGNRGGSSRAAGTFTHPVFGNPNASAVQPRYPFMGPAIDQSMEEMYAMLEESVVLVAAKHRLIADGAP